jgi:hypothetical protein
LPEQKWEEQRGLMNVVKLGARLITRSSAFARID